MQSPVFIGKILSFQILDNQVSPEINLRSLATPERLEVLGLSRLRSSIGDKTMASEDEARQTQALVEDR